LNQLAQQGKVEPLVVKKAIDDLGIDAEKADPVRS